MLGILSMGCLMGCVSNFSPEFVVVAQDHRQLTMETNSALVYSIEEELDETTDPAEREALADLIERLVIINAQAEAIDKFVKEDLTSEQLAMFLRAKWRTQ